MANNVATNAIHYYSVNSSNQAAGSNYLNDGATGLNAMAAGPAAKAQTGASVAIGNGANTVRSTVNMAAASGDSYGVAIGNNASARIASSIAIGNGALTENTSASATDPVSSIAIGTNAAALGTRSISIGENTGTGSGPQGANNVAVGIGSGRNIQSILAASNGGVAVGGANNVAFGNSSGNDVTGAGNLAVGNSSGSNVGPMTDIETGPTGARKEYCLFGPFYCYGGAGAGSNNTAIGPNAAWNVKGSQNIGIGFRAGANVNGNNNMAVGQLAGWIVDGSGNAAIGSFAGSSVTGHTNTAVGNGAGMTVVGSSNSAVGNGAGQSVTGLRNAGFGNAAGLGVNGNDNLALGSYAGRRIKGDNNITIGNDANQSSDPANPIVVSYATAIGRSSRAWGTNTIALGRSAVAGIANNTDVVDSIAVGNAAIATGTKAIALGSGAQASGAQSISIGTGNKVYAAGSGAIGDPTTIIADATDSYSIGNNNTVNTADTFVMGNSVTTTVGNSVYLGTEATASSDLTAASAGTTTYASSTINGVTYNYAGGTPVGVVTVGKAEGERRIQNVAAGLIGADSTDAINGSQLYATNQAIAAATTTANQGWNLTAQGTNSSNVAPAATVDLNNTDGNIAISKTATNNNVTFNLNPNLNVASVTTGNTTMNSAGVTVSDGTNTTTLTQNGLTITGGPSVTTGGIDAGGQTLTNVAAGVNDTDAVNLGQLNQKISEFTNIAAAGWELQANGDAPTSIAPEATLKVLNGKNTTVSLSGNELQVNVIDTPTFTSVTTNTLTAGDTTINSDGVNIQGGPTLTKTNVDMGGQQIHNVAEGTSGTDAVNVNQLNKALANVGGTNPETVRRLEHRINEVDKQADAAAAAAMAVAGLPQAYLPGKSMMAIGASTYNGQVGYAIGVSTITDGGSWVFKGTATGNSQNRYGATIGAGYQW